MFHSRYNCLKTTINEAQDFVSYAGTVNRECEYFKLSELNNDQFKCLIFICGLNTSKYSDIRTRLLAKVEADPTTTLQALTTECERIISLKHDTALVEQSSTSSFSVKQVAHKEPQRRASDQQRVPKSACWNCGELHYSNKCPYKHHQCKQCKRKGHKDNFCKQQNRAKTHFKSNIVHLVSRICVSSKRLKYVRVTINQISIDLQLDSGSDITIVSETVWIQLGSPIIRETKHTAVNASGSEIK